ncbi:MAG: response regulator [Crocinitomicaceae bacterium]|nr:response regulator [Crocinitomicaceae bacterium]
MRKGEKKFKILVVDDEQFNQKIIQKKLESTFNCEVRAFSNAVDCILALKNESPDLIVCDYYLTRRSLGQLNGDYLLDFIHKKYPNVPVIMYSHLLDFHSQLNLIGMGASDFIPRDKDFLINLIKSTRRHLINAREKMKEKRLTWVYISVLVGTVVLGSIGTQFPQLGLDFWDVIIIWCIVLSLYFAYTVVDRKTIVRQ